MPAATEPGPVEPGRVGAVVVSYFTGPSLAETLRRLGADPAIGQLVLVDNGNDPATLDALRQLADPRLVILSGHGNIGFAAGSNLGAARIDRPYLLLINPDCLIEPGSLDGLIQAVGARPHPWIATVRLLEQDGREQNGARRNQGSPGQCLSEALRLYRLPGRWPRLNLADRPLPDGLVPVPAISGAFMLMPRATWQQVGGMDPGYFLHVEDLDFCRRLADLDGVAYFWPAAAATHLKSTSQASSWFVERHKIAGFRRFFETHFRRSHVWPLRCGAWALIAVGLASRAFVKTLKS
jgi:GT2 family glycosyltransferase